MVKVRFAPSPTGNLHIGSVRTALFNWLFAQHHRGTYILRIEDTDLLRSTEAFEDNILQGLKWLGLDWDCGPDMLGSTVFYRQTERIHAHLYDEYIHKLLDQGDAYPCFCSHEDLEIEKEGHSGYSGKCRNLTSDQIQKFRDAGKSSVVRFRIKPETLIVQDIIRGNVQFDTALISDLIIQKADGVPSYNFAVVVDDILMGITHVIRGEDHLPNTPKQIQIYNALGSPLPFFAHLPMILGPDKSKLSKRHGATSVLEYQEMGFLPQVLVNYLALLGWSHPEGKEKLDIDEIIHHFDLERISKSGAVFDVDKLKWLNGLYLRELHGDDLYQLVFPFLQRAYSDKLLAYDSTWLLELVESIRDHLTLASDIVHYTEDFFVEDLDYQQEIFKKYLDDDFAGKLLLDVSSFLANLTFFSETDIQAYINELPAKYGVNKAKVLKPLRVALTGKDHGLSLIKIILLFGREKSLSRLGGVLHDKKQY